MGSIEGPLKEIITKRQFALWLKIDPKLGQGVADGLDVKIDRAMTKDLAQNGHASGNGYTNGKGNGKSEYAAPLALDKTPHGSN